MRVMGAKMKAKNGIRVLPVLLVCVSLVGISVIGINESRLARVNSTSRAVVDWSPQLPVGGPSPNLEVNGSSPQSVDPSTNGCAGGCALQSIPVGADPGGIAVDAALGRVFVANGGSANMSVISDKTDRVVSTVTLSGGDQGVSVDPARGDVYVTEGEPSLSQVTVISAATGSVVAKVPVCNPPTQGDPNGIAYDAAKGETFVSCYGTSIPDLVSIIDDSTNRVIANVTVGINPEGVAYDPPRGEVFVVNSGEPSSSVSVIDDTTNSVVATIPVGIFPQGIAYDSAKGELYVSNYQSNAGGQDTVSVIDDSTNAVVATMDVGSDPTGVSYDPTLGTVFVAEQKSGNVTVINDTSNDVVGTIPVGVTPVELGWDQSKNELFVTNQGSNNVTVISYSPHTLHSVTFTQAGLASGKAWKVTVGTKTKSSKGAISFELHYGTYSYAVPAIEGYRNLGASSSGTFTVAGSDLSERITFTPLPMGVDNTVSLTSFNVVASPGKCLPIAKLFSQCFSIQQNFYVWDFTNPTTGTLLWVQNIVLVGQGILGMYAAADYSIFNAATNPYKLLACPGLSITGCHPTFHKLTLPLSVDLNATISGHSLILKSWGQNFHYTVGEWSYVSVPYTQSSAAPQLVVVGETSICVLTLCSGDNADFSNASFTTGSVSAHLLLNESWSQFNGFYIVQPASSASDSANDASQTAETSTNLGWTLAGSFTSDPYINLLEWVVGEGVGYWYST